MIEFWGRKPEWGTITGGWSDRPILEWPETKAMIQHEDIPFETLPTTLHLSFEEIGQLRELIQMEGFAVIRKIFEHMRRSAVSAAIRVGDTDFQKGIYCGIHMLENELRLRAKMPTDHPDLREPQESDLNARRGGSY